MSEYRNHLLDEEQNKIIDEAQSVLPRNPVDVVRLVKKFGCKYSSIKLEWRVSGAIHHDDGIYHIYVNENEPETRQRFTCAHELAHYLRHREYLSDRHTENIMLRSNLSNEFEVQANKIAADILMPQKYLSELAESRKYSFESLAKVFNVSRQALLVRLGIPEYYRFVS